MSANKKGNKIIANPAGKGPKPQLREDAGAVYSRAKNMDRTITSHRNSAENRGVHLRGRAGGPQESEFPAQYLPAMDEEDDRVRIKQKLVKTAGGGVNSPFGQVTLSDSDLAYIKKKESLETKMLFDQWYANLFDTTDINKLRLAQEIYPDYYKIREDEIDRQAALQKKLALIKLRGPKDLDDLQFLFALISGQVKVNEKPLFKLNEPTDDALNSYRRGWFNPRRYLVREHSQHVPAHMGRGLLADIGASAWEPTAQSFGFGLPSGLAGEWTGSRAARVASSRRAY
jgi:hypothetical protein